MIDQASVFAERYKGNPQVLQATVLGQGNIPGLDPYTALNALRLIKESNAMQMAGRAQQPTSSPSILAETLAPPAPPQGLAGMMPMGAPAGQMPQRAPMPQPTMQAASGGLAGMYTPDEDYAAGGIVAFQEGGLNAVAVTDDATRRLVGSGDGDDGSSAGMNFPMFTSTGDPKTYATLAGQLPEAIQGISDYKATGMTPEQYGKIQEDEIAAYRKAMGPNTAMESLASDIAERKKERAGNLEEGKGIALLKAAYAVTQGNNWARAFAGAGAAFGDEYNRALQADKAEKRSIALAEFNMADAQRKENLGLFKEGRAAADRATTAQQAADKARLEKAKAYADAVTKGMNATKPLRSAFSGAGAGGASSKDFIVGPETYLAQIKEEHPDWSPAKQKAEAFKLFQQGKSAGLQGAVIKADTATAQLTAKQNESVAKSMAVWEGGGEARKAKAAGTYAEVAAAKKEALRQDALRGVFDTDSEETPNAAPAAAPTAKPRTVLKFDQSGKQIK